MGYDYGTAVESSGNSLGDIADILGSVESLASLASAGIGLIIFIICAVVIFALILALYILHSVPVYKMAKKLNMNYAWLAWVPIFHDCFRLYVLSEMAGDKVFDPGFGNFKVANRRTSFLIYVIIKWLGAAIVGTVVTLISLILPILGYFSGILSLLPAAACAVFEYVYLRDALNLFKEDEKANHNTALIISIIEAVTGLNLIKTIYLYTVMKNEPLSLNADEDYVEYTITTDEIPAQETVSAE